MDRVIAGRRVLFDLSGAEPAAVELVALQIEAFLDPHMARISQILEEKGRILPDPVRVRLVTSDEDRRHPTTWHIALGTAEASGLRLAERVFVQALLASSPPVTHVVEAHRLACAALASTVDETFICMLEILAD